MANSLTVPLFHDPEFMNLGAKSKKPATIAIHLYLDAQNQVFTTSTQSKRQVIGFKDPQTGLFITDLKNGEPHPNSPYRQFRLAALQYATDAVYDKLTTLQTLYDQDATTYTDSYKPVAVIKNELNHYLTVQTDFYTQLQKEIDLLVLTSLPHVNEYLLFKDDALNATQYQTKRLPYLNPSKQTVTAAQTALVESFFNVFADEYNTKVIAWYFGAILSNVKLQDDRVSKVLVVTSSNGGSGKSTLFTALANGLLTKDYRVIDSGFDKHFRANDKFNTSNLPTCRLGIYSEAYFNAETSGELDHNFSGLDESEMKSWITDGYVANEQKYADKQISQLTGLQIILTNHLPQIDPKRTDLTRRFLAAIIKPTSMVVEKARALNLYSANAVIQFVTDHAQAFANYCTHVFKHDPRAFQNVDYDYYGVQEDLKHAEQVVDNDQQRSKTALLQADPTTALLALGQQYHIDVKAFVDHLIEQRQQLTDHNLYFDDQFLYLNSTKQFFNHYQILPLRSAFKTFYGTPVKKQHQRMFKLPLNQQ